MKLKKWMYGALVLGLFGACSNDDVPSGGGTTQVPDGYFAVNLQLPTQQGTRAGNDDYEDGTVNEYTVSNAAIVIFRGTPDASKTSYENERAATFVGAYSLYDLDPATPDVDDDNITTQYSKVAKVNSFDTEAADKLYALALLNYNETVISIDENGNKLKVGGADFNGTFGDLMEMETNHNLFNGESTDADKFFMTNAPLSNTPGSPTRGTLAATVPAIGNVQVLAAFDKNKIAESEAEARQKPATSIYVERAVAKATLESVPGKAHIGKTDFEILFWGWYVDNTEKTSYIVRNLGIDEGLLKDYLGYTTGGEYETYRNHRFVGSVPMGNVPGLAPTNPGTPDNPLLYRIYWCKDPNYDKPDAAYNTVFLEEDFSELTEEQRKAKEEELNGYFKNKDYIFYPHENTFNVANQNFHSTTRAVFRMTIGADKDGVAKTFYTRNGDENNLYTSVKDATSVIVAFLTGVDPTSGTTTPSGQADDSGSAVSPEPNNVAGYNTDIREAFKKALNKNKSFTYGTGNIKVIFKTDETGCYKVANIELVVSDDLVVDENDKTEEQKNKKTFAVHPDIAFQTSATKEALINYLNSTWKILEYKDGHSYYDLRFMHFADEVVEESNDTFTYGPGELAPWKWAVTKTDETKMNTADAYGDNEPYYLGRYGMVRNNWYSLSIGAVRHLGTPVPPKVQNVKTSDDNKAVEKFIAVNVKVKAWAKRTQKHNF